MLQIVTITPSWTLPASLNAARLRIPSCNVSDTLEADGERNDLQHKTAVRGRSARPRHLSSRGFTLIETVIVVAIALVLGAIAVPFIQSTIRYFSLRAAASSLSGAIQSTRYQAIFHGCKYQIAFRAATYDYQISRSDGQRWRRNHRN